MSANAVKDANATMVAEDEKQMLAVVEQNHLQLDTAQNLQKQFAPLFTQARNAIEKSRGITVTDASQTLQIKMARLCRLELKAIRVAGEKTRKEIKEDSLRRSKAIDGFAAILNDLIGAEETRLEQQEKIAEMQEANRKAALRSDREKILTGIQVDPNLYQLGDMTEETFQQLVEGTKLARAAEAERKRKEEAERIEREAKEQAERERIRAENERLKEEAKAKEAARLEIEQKAAIERELAAKELKRLADEKAATEAKAQQEREAAEAKATADRMAAECETARQLAEQKRIADEAAKTERERAEKEQAEVRILAAQMLAEQHRKDEERHAKIVEERRVDEETAKQERLRLQAIADAERQKAETARKTAEAKATAEREEHARKVREMEQAAAELRAKEKAARDELEAKAKAAREAEEKRVADEKETARKAAMAPDKDKLLSYANTIRSLDIPVFSTPEAQAVGQLVASQRNKFVLWLESRSEAL